MAKCTFCGREFDPDVSELEYDRDSFIRKNKLKGTYHDHTGCCADCAVQEVMDRYPQERV